MDSDRPSHGTKNTQFFRRANGYGYHALILARHAKSTEICRRIVALDAILSAISDGRPLEKWV